MDLDEINRFNTLTVDAKIPRRKNELLFIFTREKKLYTHTKSTSIQASLKFVFFLLYTYVHHSMVSVIRTRDFFRRRNAKVMGVMEHDDGSVECVEKSVGEG